MEDCKSEKLKVKSEKTKILKKTLTDSKSLIFIFKFIYAFFKCRDCVAS